MSRVETPVSDGAHDLNSGTLHTGMAILDYGNDDQEDDIVTRFTLFTDYSDRIQFTVNGRPYCSFSEHLDDGGYMCRERFSVTGGSEWF